MLIIYVVGFWQDFFGLTLAVVQGYKLTNIKQKTLNVRTRQNNIKCKRFVSRALSVPYNKFD